MATNRWLGRALAVAKVSTHTVDGTAAISQVYTVTINGKSITYTSSGVDTNSTIAAALQVLLAASTITEFAELTWTVNGAIITSTSDTPGQNQIITSSATGTGTFVTATTTAASGPNRWDVAVNWSLGSVPVDGEDVILDLPVSILDGLDQSAVTLASLTISDSFGSAYIGLPRTSANGYPEFREQSLKIGTTTFKCDAPSGRIKIDFGTVQVAGEVRKTGQGVEQGIQAALLKGTHASNAFDVQSGSVGFAIVGGETATLLTLRTAASAQVLCGAGCTIGTVSGEGTVVINSAVTTMTQAGGQWTTNGSGAITTLTQNGGLLNHNSSGTITTATIGGTLNCGGDATPRTITTLTINKAGRILDPLNTLTITNNIARASNVREILAA
jgi:hypothetical protein